MPEPSAATDAEFGRCPDCQEPMHPGEQHGYGVCAVQVAMLPGVQTLRISDEDLHKWMGES